MLDRLPVELLAHTLSFVDAPSSHRLVKHTSLYSCCLVSKRVKEVAQPLLWRAVSVDKKGDLEVVKREVAAGEVGQHTRILEAAGEEIEAAEVGALVQNLPGLAEVRLRNFEANHSNGIDELLPHLQHLRPIRLATVDFKNITTALPGNNLSSLFLYDVYATESFIASLLQPRKLPVLRSLYLANLSADEGETTFLPSIDDTLLAQLDVLQLPLDERHLARSELFQNPTTLFSGAIWHVHNYLFANASSQLVKNLRVRVYGLDEERVRSNATTLQYLRDNLGELTAALPSSGITILLLPIPLQQRTLPAECDKVLAACRTKGIEVLWEDDTGAGEEDVFSEEFRRWVVKRKRDEAERAS